MSWHTPMTRVTVWDPLLQQQDGVGVLCQSGLLLSHSPAEGAVGLPGQAGSVRGCCWPCQLPTV